MKAIVLLLVALLAGCATPESKEHQKVFARAAPRSILVVPIARGAFDRDVPSYVLSTVAIPLASKGYYVFPVHTALAVLARDGADIDPAKLAERTGADAIMYVGVNRWDKDYGVFVTTVTVDFSFSLVSKDGAELWTERVIREYGPEFEQNSFRAGDLIASAISAAWVNARPQFLQLALKANHEAFFNLANPIPAGPYLQRQ